MIHKEGYRSIILCILVCALLLIITNYCCPSYISYTVIFDTLLLIIILQFFRNPKRNISQYNDKHVFAPADGKIVIIEKCYEDEYFKTEKLLVSIFMSPLNVHVNRNPISGIIKYFKYHSGKYLVAWHPKSSKENERTTIVIDHQGQEILLRQIAGALARRIVSYVNTGDTVKQGEDFGFIKFGSRVDIYLPLETKINVKLEQIVKGNIDIIAEL